MSVIEVVVVLLILIQIVISEEDEYYRAMDPSDELYIKDYCTSCNSIFDRLDRHIEGPRPSGSNALIAASLLTEDLCEWTIGPTREKCHVLIESLEEEFENYLTDWNVNNNFRTDTCSEWCEK